MYDTKYVCQYKNVDVFLETDTIDDLTKDKIRNILYRNDMLHIFNINDFDETVIDNAMKEIFHSLKNNEEFYELMQKVCKKIIVYAEDAYIGLLLLYSFDYLQTTHMCVSEILETGEITKEHLESLYEVTHIDLPCA
jgi:hypothetical protein